MRLATLSLLLILAGFSMGQNTWDTGDLGFQYGSPLPNQTVAISGSFLSTGIPSQGVGGFQISQGDTNFLSLVAYDIQIVDGDTLADIFALILQDTVAIEAGYHVVGFGPGAVKLFIWMEDVDPALVAALIDTSFTLDSLDTLNPYISLSGQIEITEISSTGLSGNFAGAMVNTNLDMAFVSGGTFAVSNSLPVLEYAQGSLAYSEDSQTQVLEGELNPLQSTAGVGAYTTQQGDTINTHLLAYATEEPGDLSIYGLMLRGEAADYPVLGAAAEFVIGADPTELPLAVPFVIKHASPEQLITLLNSETPPALNDFDSLYLPAALDTVSFSYTAEGGLLAAFEGLLLANGLGETHLVTEAWSLGTNVTTAIDPVDAITPQTRSLVGRAFPNPFNSSVVIPLYLTSDARVQLTLFNLLGQAVLVQDAGTLTRGIHAYPLNLGRQQLGGGLYIFKISTSTGQAGSGTLIYLK